MTTAISLIVGGNSYNVNNGAPFLVTAWEGLGALPRARLAQSGPQQHGETDLGWRGLPRYFSLAFTIVSTGLGNCINANRRALMRYLTPQADPLSILFNFDGTQYQIDAHPLSEPGALAASDIYKLAAVPVRFRAADPTLYHPTLNSTSWTLSVQDDLILPFTLPFVLGSSMINDTKDIAYTGDVDSYPVIEMTGPLPSPHITNEESGDTLALAGGQSIAVGKTVTFDLRYGNKTVMETGGVSRIADLSTSLDDLSTFRLLAAVDGTASRTNTLRVTASEAVAGQSAIKIKHYTRYGGF